MAQTTTLQDVYNICYWIISQGQDATAYPTSLLKAFINDAQNDICYWTLQNLSTNERIEKQALSFLEKNVFYSTRRFSTLSSNAVVWWTTLTCTNTFSSSWYLWIWWNIIQYLANDWTTISWISPIWEYSISFAHISWTQVFQLNELPSDFWQLSRVFLTLQNTRQRIALVWIDDRDLYTTNPNSYIYRFFFDVNYYSWSWWVWREWYYSIIRWRFILFLIPQQDWQPISFEYQQAPTQLSSSTDILTIPDDYALTTVPYIATAEMLANRWDLDEALKLNNFWFQKVKNMYQFYSTIRKELQYNQRVRTLSDWYLEI